MNPSFLRVYFVSLILCHAAIFGAWLGGATPTGWTFILAFVFSLCLALASKISSTGGGHG
jgi:hypothetical protein